MLLDWIGVELQARSNQVQKWGYTGSWISSMDPVMGFSSLGD
jgi:hypothetical protein